MTKNMESVKEVKDWLLNKCKATTKLCAPVMHFYSPAQKTNIVVTPQNIPEFVIPGSDTSSLRGSVANSEEDWSSGSGGISMNSSPRNSPHHSHFGGLAVVPISSITNSRSAPASPQYQKIDCIPITTHPESHSFDDLHWFRMAHSNKYDQLPPMATSLPQFTGNIPYGVPTLSHCPHTRRKESLFHTQLTEADAFPLQIGSQQGILLAASYDTLLKTHTSPATSPANSPNAENSSNNNTPSFFSCPLSRKISKRRDVIPPQILTPLGIKSFDCSSEPNALSPTAADSPHHLRRPCTSHRLSPDVTVPSRSNRKDRPYYRRRSSLRCITNYEYVQHSVSAATSESSTSPCSTDCSSAEPSPNIKRRYSLSKLDSISSTIPPISPTSRIKFDITSAVDKASVYNGDLAKSVSVIDDIVDSVTSGSSEYGELKFAFQYLPASKQLKVTLIKAENLRPPQLKPEANINSYVKFYLMPGKIQKHVSDVIKRTRNPVYNKKPYYFNDVTLENVRSMKLRLKVFHKGLNFTRHELIGEVVILLDKYDLLEEQRMWKRLEKRTVAEELGSLSTSITFKPKAGRLNINIIEAKELPKSYISGPPDPYVKVEVYQPGRGIVKKQTKTHKKNTDPQFREFFSFQVSPRFEDLRYTTVTITVYARERIRKDDIIGQVRLGHSGTEDSELDQWNQAMQYPGGMVTTWHQLIEQEDER